jgi:hypothetical protein
MIRMGMDLASIMVHSCITNHNQHKIRLARSTKMERKKREEEE